MNRFEVSLRRVLLPYLLACVGSLARPGSVPAQCPENSVRCGAFSYHQILTTAAARDSAECSEAGDAAGAYYDLRIPWLAAGASGGDTSASAIASVHDTYQVVGLEPGTPVSLVAEIHASGGAGAYGHCAFSPWASISAMIRRADGVKVTASAATTYSYPDCVPVGTGGVNATMQLPLEVVAGDSFDLYMEVESSASWGDGSISLSGLTFIGLPSGASIVSCQGFVHEDPVQTQQASWGRLKAIYR